MLGITEEIAKSINECHPGLTIQVWCPRIYVIRIKVDDLGKDVTLDLRHLPIQQCCLPHRLLSQLRQTGFMVSLLRQHDLVRQETEDEDDEVSSLDDAAP